MASPPLLRGFDPTLILVLNLVGTFVFGLSGGMSGVRARLDLFGAVVLAVVVGIAGGTASGKSTVTRKVRQALSAYRVVFIDQDSYYRDLSEMTLSKRREVNFDHPDAFDTDLLVRHLNELRAGRPVEKPVYSFTQHSRTGETQRVNPGDVVILDNLPSHKSAKAEAVLKQRGAWFLFLPPYSPDLNPIEMVFAKLKAHLRRIGARTIDALWTAIGDICALYSEQECWNYLKDAGYAPD